MLTDTYPQERSQCTRGGRRGWRALTLAMPPTTGEGLLAPILLFCAERTLLCAERRLLCAERMARDAKMASGWHFQEDATPTPSEVEAMVVVLEGRHGAWAAEVAEFFSTLHSLKGDAGRSWAWAGVAELVRRRIAARLAEPSP